MTYNARQRSILNPGMADLIYEICSFTNELVVTPLKNDETKKKKNLHVVQKKKKHMHTLNTCNLCIYNKK